MSSSESPGYAVRVSRIRIGSAEWRIRALADRCQFWDPEGEAGRAGIDSTSWPIFGQIWPAGIALAEAMGDIDTAGRRILEIGCGIGLSSLVLRRRGADITASDRHPLAAEFLRHNAALNGVAPVAFSRAPWAGPNPGLGRFDLIVGADLLYERDHPGLLAGFLERHAMPAAQILLADPGRGHQARFGTHMSGQGYLRSDRCVPLPGMPNARHLGSLMSFVRA